MSTADDSEVAALEAKIYQLEVKKLEYEGLCRNAGLMLEAIKDALIDAKDRIKIIGRRKAANG